MARALNKTRMRDSWLVALVSLVLILATRMLFAPREQWHETLELVGYLLVVICALGRIYTTAFLGGFKNTKIIDYGPFSVVRNPLYVFSLIGIAGISLMSLHLSVMLFAPIAIFFIYYFLVRREEAHLAETLGQKYEEYCARTPRFLPRLSLYHAPEVITVNVRYLHRAVLDAFWWFVPFPLFEFLDLINH